MSAIAIVPIRHYSQRVPEKNYRTLGGCPLYFHIIKTLLKTKTIGHIYINTDSPVIKEGLKNYNEKITVIDRDSTLCQPEVSMNQILISTYEFLLSEQKIQSDTLILQTHVTNPFLKVETIDRAVLMFKENRVETLLSVTELKKRFWNLDLKPINHSPDNLIQTQDLDIIYEENSCFYLFTGDTLVKYNNRLGNVVKFFQIDQIESWDIDTMTDFKIAESIFSIKDQTRDSLCDFLISNLDSDLLTNIKALSHKPTVLISAPYMIPTVDSFINFYHHLGIEVIVADVEERLSEEDLSKYHGKYQIALTGDDKFTSQVIEKSGVKAICKWGTGIDSIDLDYCRKTGVQVLNTPNAFSIPVSQSILAAIFGFARQTFYSDNQMKNSDKWVKYQGRTIDELTIGIVGLGSIGRHLASYLKPFDPILLGYDTNLNLPAVPGVKLVESLEKLLGQSDMICLCTTLNPTTFHLINQDNIRQIKKGSYLINMARGPLVEEVALVQALESGHLAGAALDVFEVEPLPVDSRYRDMTNVIISSHNSNSSRKYWKGVHLNTIKNSLKAMLHYFK